MSATVDIADAIADAERVPARDIEAGWYLFDVYGGRHRVARARHYVHRVTVIRVDGVGASFDRDELVTAVRP